METIIGIVGTIAAVFVLWCEFTAKGRAWSRKGRG